MIFFLLFLQLDIFPDTDGQDELLTSSLTVIVKVEYWVNSAIENVVGLICEDEIKCGGCYPLLLVSPL